MENFSGHDKIQEMVNILIKKNVTGRAILFSGQKGIGKFTLGKLIAEKLLGKNPFFSRDFLFYRNDNFSLKTAFFIKFSEEKGYCSQKAIDYFHYLMTRGYNAISFGEISNIKLNSVKSKFKIDFIEFFSEFETFILSENFFSFLSNEKVKENFFIISEELSKKETISIDFVRSWKEFESIKSSGEKKVILIGDFENATTEAQNSALKILEEPSSESLVILTTSDTSRILPTIISRCIVMKFGILKNEDLEKIFDIKLKDNKFNNTIDLMKDYIFNYRERAKKILIEFFSDIAPNIQYRGNVLFQFIERILEEGKDFVINFLAEIVEFLRCLQINRQSYIRKKTFSCNLYEEIAEKIIPRTCVSEIHTIGIKLINTIELLRKSNFSETLILPDLLINISRWYQRALLRKKI